MFRIIYHLTRVNKKQSISMKYRLFNHKNSTPKLFKSEEFNADVFRSSPREEARNQPSSETVFI